jgi:hypothetical protein
MINKSPYFDRLDQVISALEASLEQNDAAPVNEEVFMKDLKQAIPYGRTARHSFDLECYRGKGTRKALHVIIYRTASGRYELTHYYL